MTSLGENIFITVSENRGVVYISFRVCKISSKTQKLRPIEKGVSLTLSQYNALVKQRRKIKENLDAASKYHGYFRSIIYLDKGSAAIVESMGKGKARVAIEKNKQFNFRQIKLSSDTFDIFLLVTGEIELNILLAKKRIADKKLEPQQTTTNHTAEGKMATSKDGEDYSTVNQENVYVTVAGVALKEEALAKFWCFSCSIGDPENQNHRCSTLSTKTRVCSTLPVVSLIGIKEHLRKICSTVLDADDDTPTPERYEELENQFLHDEKGYKRVIERCLHICENDYRDTFGEVGHITSVFNQELRSIH